MDRIRFNADPNPALLVNADLDTDPGLDFPNKLQLEKVCFCFSLGLHKGRPSYRRSLYPLKGIITSKIVIKFHVWVSFAPSIRIQPTNMNADPCRSGSGTPKLVLSHRTLIQARIQNQDFDKAEPGSAKKYGSATLV
jgi:hypothetical protein